MVTLAVVAVTLETLTLVTYIDTTPTPTPHKNIIMAKTTIMKFISIHCFFSVVSSISETAIATTASKTMYSLHNIDIVVGWGARFNN